MKIDTITKTFTKIELTLKDVEQGLMNYQKDQLYELALALKAVNAGQQSELFWGLLQGEYSEWFDTMCEKYNIYWLYTPVKNSEWIAQIEAFPHVFIHDAVNLLRDCAPSTLVVEFESQDRTIHTIDSQKLLSNL